jgi:CHAT domain-containing protein
MLKGAGGVQNAAQERTLLGSSGVKAQTVNYGHPYYWASFIQSGAWSGIENKTADAKRQ